MSKPILTKREVEAAKATYTKITGNTDNTMLNTIEQAMEGIQALTKEHFRSCCCVWCELLARYDGANTNGKDGE